MGSLIMDLELLELLTWGTFKLQLLQLLCLGAHGGGQ